MNSYYNLFVGSDNGLLKGINSISRTFNNLNNLENLNADKEIQCMCWTDINKQDQICFATRDQHLVKYTTNLEVSDPFEDFGQLDTGAGSIKGVDFLTEKKLVTCTENGVIKLWSLEKDENNKDIIKNLNNDFNAGANISCMKTSQFNASDSFLIATGGKENDLKVWNLNDKQEPIFRAKNVADNWVQLREPVWVMCIDFLDQNKIAVGTAYHQIRIYDIKCGMRRPVINLSYDKYPITSIANLPDNSNRLIAGNTHGEMEMIDLRVASSKDGQCKTLKKYKSFQGTIKSIQIANTPKDAKKPGLCVATCGLDRFLRVHNVETAELVSKVFLKSRLSCLLFSKYEPVKAAKSDNGKLKSKNPIDDDQLSDINSEDLGTDDLWSDMETIVEENPILLEKKRKADDRLAEFESETDQNDINEQNEQQDENNDDKIFKKPKFDF